MRRTWSNWLGNHRASPARIVEPTTVEGVSRAVDAARSARSPLRVMGAGCAWSPLVPTDGSILSMRRMTRIREIDRARCRITVETGALLDEVVRVAACHGMSVKSPSMFLGLSIGGLIATGSHGTGRSSATVGDAVVSFEMVGADGTVRTVDAPGSDLWRAAITSLGAIGVITSVTLQCEPLYNVLESHVRVHPTEVGPLLPRMLADFELVSVFWHPSSRWALFKLGNRTMLPAEDVRGRIDPSRLDRASAWLGRLTPILLRRLPAMHEPIARLIDRGVGAGSRVVSEPYFSHYQQVYPPVISSEFAIPIDVAPDAWSWVTSRLSEYGRAGVSPVNLTAHARFSGPSQAFLASAAGRATCHLEVLDFAGNAQRELFQSEFHQKMTSAFEGRPHWGKDIARPWQAARRYGENLDRFLEVRHELDPEQRLLNAFLRDEVFGLARRVAPRARASVRASERAPEAGAPASAE